MTVTIEPFTAAHLEPAAALLAARHRRDRALHPDLPPGYEDPAAACAALGDIVATDGMRGVVALRDGQPVGYLLGAPVFPPPTSMWAGAMRPRAAEIPYAGHAIHPRELESDGGSLYRRLYAVLSEQWLRDGLTGHYVTIPADRDSAEPWLDLGFGRLAAFAVRGTEPPPREEPGITLDIAVRRAGAGDEDVVQALVTELVRALAAPPIFLPFLPETAVGRRQVVAEYLADPLCPYWLAFAAGRPMGMQMFEEPASPHWHQSPLESPEQGLYLYLACTLPEARGRGVGAALLARTMAWAREAGYERCALHYLTASHAASFWRGRGFRPVTYWMCRAIDERAVWATGNRGAA
jgi:GNAT superfamily N-acetyltransferase